MYAEGGVERYWVVARDALHVHARPGPDGYAFVEVLWPDDVIALAYGPGRTIAVADLLG